SFAPQCLRVWVSCRFGGRLARSAARPLALSPAPPRCYLQGDDGREPQSPGPADGRRIDGAEPGGPGRGDLAAGAVAVPPLQAPRRRPRPRRRLRPAPRAAPPPRPPCP